MALAAAISHRRQSGLARRAITSRPRSSSPTTIGAIALLDRAAPRRVLEPLPQADDPPGEHRGRPAHRRSATSAPASPATRQPIRLAISMFGPGAACPMRRLDEFGCDIQPFTSTTQRCISGITEGMAAEKQREHPKYRASRRGHSHPRRAQNTRDAKADERHDDERSTRGRPPTVRKQPAISKSACGFLRDRRSCRA